MMNNELISVIIPIYNGAGWLSNAVNSALNQTYTNIELLLIDDGSTDDSLSICKKFETDSRVKVIHKENGGQASARNLGLEESHGKYIQFLDCDDTLELDACAVAMRAIRSDVDFVMYGFNVFRQGHLLRTPHPEHFLYTGQYQHFKEITKLLSSPCNKLYRRSYITKPFPEECVYGEDGIFNFENFTKETVVVGISDCLYNVNLDNQTSVNKRYKEGRMNDTFNSILVRFKKITEMYGEKCVLEDYLKDAIATICHTIRLSSNNHSYKQFNKELEGVFYPNKYMVQLLRYAIKEKNIKFHNIVLIKLLLSHRTLLLYLCCRIQMSMVNI